MAQPETARAIAKISKFFIAIGYAEQVRFSTAIMTLWQILFAAHASTRRRGATAVAPRLVRGGSLAAEVQLSGFLSTLQVLSHELILRFPYCSTLI